ncbi:MAG: hypothetical protein WA364_07230, partial [Candidatus Nitrosopolaris sp.]
MMPDIISWDKAIDKKLKSSDNKDLGKIQSTTNEYIQTKEGSFSKNYYYIPKYYIQGYDGDHLWVSLTKDDVKSRFERENAPSSSELETPDYVERKTLITKQYSDFDRNIPSYTASAVHPSQSGSSSLDTASTSQSSARQDSS